MKKYLSLLLFISFNLCFSQNDCDDAYFEFDKQMHNSDILPAIFKINILGTYGGTGFLIDKERGLLVTAAHVIPENNQNPIHAWNNYLKEKIEFEFVGNLKKSSLDLAILKVKNYDNWKINLKTKRISDLDIDFYKPTQKLIGKKFRLFSYINTSALLNDIEDQASYGECIVKKVSNLFYQHYDFKTLGIIIDRESVRSESGSPIVNEKGQVVGVLVETFFDTNTSLIIPSTNISWLIDFISKNETIKNLESKLKSNSISLDELINMFDTNANINAISNYEIMLWLNEALKKPKKELSYLDDYMKCPIIEILHSRDLIGLLTKLSIRNKLANLDDESLKKILLASSKLIEFEKEYGEARIVNELVNERIQMILDHYKTNFPDNDNYAVINNWNSTIEFVESVKKIGIENYTEENPSYINLLDMDSHRKLASLNFQSTISDSLEISLTKYNVIGDLMNMYGYPNLAAKAYLKANQNEKIDSMISNDWIKREDVDNQTSSLKEAITKFSSEIQLDKDLELKLNQILLEEN